MWPPFPVGAPAAASERIHLHALALLTGRPLWRPLAAEGPARVQLTFPSAGFPRRSRGNGARAAGLPAGADWPHWRAVAASSPPQVHCLKAAAAAPAVDSSSFWAPSFARLWRLPGRRQGARRARRANVSRMDGAARSPARCLHWAPQTIHHLFWPTPAEVSP